MTELQEDVPHLVVTTQDRLRVYFEPATGKLRGHDNGDLDDPPMQGGLEWIAVPVGCPPDPKTMMVDLVSIRLRPMNAGERRLFNAPSKIDLQVIRRRELFETDWRESQPEWASYRQKLRDITQAGAPLDMIDVWPLRPDGTDALEAVRAVIL